MERRVIKVDSAQINLKDDKLVKLASTVVKKVILGEIVLNRERHNLEQVRKIVTNAINKDTLPENVPNKVKRHQYKRGPIVALTGLRIIVMSGEQTMKSNLLKRTKSHLKRLETDGDNQMMMAGNKRSWHLHGMNK